MLSVVLFHVVMVPYRVLSAAGDPTTRDVAAVRIFKISVRGSVPKRIQFDRFSAPVEKRYDANEVRGTSPRRRPVGRRKFRPCFGWLGDGVKR